jgi:hypothetical protein
MLTRRHRKGTSLLIAVGLIVTGASLGVRMDSQAGVSAQQRLPFTPRRFYLSKTEHDGAHALSGCATGFHMAALWEIVDPSNLVYDTTLGFSWADIGLESDAGSSVPADAHGWVRTGGRRRPLGNCMAWTSSSTDHDGSLVLLPDGTHRSPPFDADNWANPATVVSPWRAATANCVNPNKVWCVQDQP